MDNYAYAASYPESGDSSPRSREIDFENTPPWEDQTAAIPSNNYKVKLMCSYGGKILPRPHDNQLSYIGGETKILVVDRGIKFSGFVSKLSALCDADACFKYQLPGEDLDALISVTNDDDLEHMMHEYDRLYRTSSKPARLRLFLFPVINQAAAAAAADARAGIFGSSEGKSDRERFVDALNSGPTQSSPPPSTDAPSNNVDFLFGLHKGTQPPPPPPMTAKIQDTTPELEIQVPPLEERIIAADPIQMQIQDLQRLQIGAQDQAMHRRRNDDNLVGGFTPPLTLPANLPAAVSTPPGYWPENHVAGVVYPGTTPVPDQSMYMISAPAGVYHAPMGRPMTGPANQGYYAVQRMPPDVYRDQPSVYNVVPPAPGATAVAPPGLPPQPQAKVSGFSEGIGMMRPATAVGVGVVDTGYAPIAYDNGAGRHVFYNTPGGVMPPPPYQPVAAAVSADMRPALALNPEGKVAVKASQGSV
ncbi:hypothetical protein U1Q18_035249 [Sarracenia purpurea var. burkii]